MSYIDIKTETSEFRIDLNNHPFTKKWINYMNNIHFPNFVSNQWGFYQSFKECPVIENKFYVQLDHALNYCNTNIAGYDFSDSLQALREFKIKPLQSHLNIIHRTFTSLEHLCYSKNFNSNMVEMIQAINTLTHLLEVSYTLNNDRRARYPAEICTIVFRDANNLVDPTEIFNHIIYDTFDHTAENINYNVWLNEDILGKDLIRCFLDDDDPTCSDITGNMFMTPSLMIDINDTFYEILLSREFNEWHRNKAPYKKLNRWPIGNVDLTKYSLPLTYGELVNEYKIYND